MNITVLGHTEIARRLIKCGEHGVTPCDPDKDALLEPNLEEHRNPHSTMQLDCNIQKCPGEAGGPIPDFNKNKETQQLIAMTNCGHYEDSNVMV